MSDSIRRSSLELARLHKGFSRERVGRELNLSSKTVERHERRVTPVKRWQLEQYAALYGATMRSLNDMLDEVAA